MSRSLFSEGLVINRSNPELARPADSLSIRPSVTGNDPIRSKPGFRFVRNVVCVGRWVASGFHTSGASGRPATAEDLMEVLLGWIRQIIRIGVLAFLSKLGFKALFGLLVAFVALVALVVVLLLLVLRLLF